MAGLTKNIVVRQRIDPVTKGGSHFAVLGTFDFINGTVTSAQVATGYEAHIVNSNNKVAVKDTWTVDLYTVYGQTQIITLIYDKSGVLEIMILDRGPRGYPVDSVDAACFVLNNGEVVSAELLNGYEAVVTNTDGEESVEGLETGEKKVILQRLTRPR